MLAALAAADTLACHQLGLAVSPLLLEGIQAHLAAGSLAEAEGTALVAEDILAAAAEVGNLVVEAGIQAHLAAAGSWAAGQLQACRSCHRTVCRPCSRRILDKKPSSLGGELD